MYVRDFEVGKCVIFMVIQNYSILPSYDGGGTSFNSSYTKQSVYQDSISDSQGGSVAHVYSIVSLVGEFYDQSRRGYSQVPPDKRIIR